jgi:ribosomal subunit interface protein
MRLQVKGKNHEVSDTIRRYAEEKMQKLDRQLHELAEVELELRVEKNLRSPTTRWRKRRSGQKGRRCASPRHRVT